MRMKNGKLKGLTGKKAVFVIEYTKDFASRRAAEASGYPPDKGIDLLNDEKIASVIESIINERMEDTGIDAEYLMYELADNHRIARQQGNIGASNTALKILAQFASIDALAKRKIELDVTSDKELMDRLYRGRTRLLKSSEAVSFLEND